MAVFKSRDFWGWYQFASGEEVFPLGKCTTIDTLPDPSQGSAPILCLDENGNFVQEGETLEAPAQPTFNITTLIEKAASGLEMIKEARCRFNFYVTASDCGRRNVWTNKERVYAYKNARITDSPITTPRTMDADAKVESAFALIGWIGRGDHRPLTAERVATIETAALNAITSCSGQCAGACGPRVGICQQLRAAAETVAAAVPDMLISNDTAVTWTSPATGFAATESVMSSVCVQIDKDTQRNIAVRDADAANPLEINYSDDDWVTNTLVVVGATANEAAVGANSMFALDAEHIWLATDDGRMFFSADAGESWDDQTTALAASGAAVLNAVHFCNRDVGFAVGAGDVIIGTLDGGTNWATMTATGSGDGLNTVHCFDENRLFVGTDSAVSDTPAYMSYDRTANWTEITEGLGIAVTDTIAKATFIARSGIAGLDDLTGYLVKNTAAPLGTVYKSVDGGFSWAAITTPPNSGINDIHICQANAAYAVGEQHTGTSYIVRVNG